MLSGLKRLALKIGEIVFRTTRIAKRISALITAPARGAGRAETHATRDPFFNYYGCTLTILTIGFTRKSAEVFFGRLQVAGVRRIIDVRLNNVSQLAGFTKKDDLRYFAKAVCGIEYVHLTELAPTAEMLDAYKKAKKPDWSLYEQRFLELLRTRHVEQTISRELLDGGCLLCSEEKPEHCHRRLVAEYLQAHWPQVEIQHIP